ncbi:MAG: hypothetical protein QM765_53665 [Myxococcales bacterium]
MSANAGRGREWIAVLAVTLVGLACSQPGGGSTSLPTTAKVLYLHHSTGGVVWGNGVPDALTAYNTQHATSYAISELAYPDAPYPWANYPYDYWHLWVEDGGQAASEGVATLEALAQDRDVVVFKHCFPVSGIEADTGSPDIASQAKTLENYKLQYAALKARLRQMPGKRFIVWTGAALRQEDSNLEQGARARQFSAWVKTTWDEPGDNIYVWDFFELETERGNFLAPANATGDSHPNDTFAKRAAPLFVKRLVDVIEGRGDSGSLTGE